MRGRARPAVSPGVGGTEVERAGAGNRRAIEDRSRNGISAVTIRAWK